MGLKLVKIYEGLNNSNELKIDENYLGDLIYELNQYDSSEGLLRGGGLSNELLDRLAFGFSEGDVKVISPNDLKIRWRNDLYNVKWEIEQSGMDEATWSKGVDLSEPIDVDYTEDLPMGYSRGFYLQDGHHRYTAAKILGKKLNVKLLIKLNPIKEISDSLGYDELHRVLYDKYVMK